MKYLIGVLLLITLLFTAKVQAYQACTTTAVWDCCPKVQGYHIETGGVCFPDDPTPCPYDATYATSDAKCVKPVEPTPTETAPAPQQVAPQNTPVQTPKAQTVQSNQQPTPQATSETPNQEEVTKIEEVTNNNGGDQLDTYNPQQIGLSL